MKRTVCLALALMLSLSACFSPVPGEEEEKTVGAKSTVNSRSNPAGVNETLVFECTEFETAFTLEMTLLEVRRGGSALKTVMQADNYNAVPARGREYILAKFHIKALQSQNDQAIDPQYMFAVVKADGSTYSDSFAYAGGLPMLSTVYEGGATEGYVLFEVDGADKDLLFVFPGYGKSQAWFSAAPTTGREDDDFSPFGDANKPGSRNNPAKLNETVSHNSIDLPRAYKQFHVNITVTELNRGQRALDMAMMASKYNDPPPGGKEYIIAKVKVDAIASKDNAVIDISKWDFGLFSAAGVEYTDSAYIYDLENEGLSQMYPGASQEGYLVFLADTDDEKPYIVAFYDTDDPVWISADQSNREPLIDPDRPGTRRNPVPLEKSHICRVDSYSGTYTVDMTMLGYVRGTVAEDELDELGVSIYNLNPLRELIIIVVEVTALESKNDAKISISDYDFDLVSGDGTKYDSISVYGLPELNDMYAGATQFGCIFFQVDPFDRDPLIVFNESYGEEGFWFSLSGEPGFDWGDRAGADV